MRAIMLAAGLGQRLSGGNEALPPKSLLDIGGKSLLDRHLDILAALGIEELVLVLGYHKDEIEAAIKAKGKQDFVRPILNPDYRRGSLLSLNRAREALFDPEGVLFMDADVLYHPRLLEVLVEGQGTLFPYDRDYEPGDEPVKLCLHQGQVVEFRKKVGDLARDTEGEWPGFARIGPAEGPMLAKAIEALIAEGRLDDPYEEAMRAVMLERPEAIGALDITGIPWIEIDFPADLERARAEMLPKIAAWRPQ
jgi:choline kinase